jgi:hypothetical protein
MNWSAFKTRFQYNYKKWIAITLSSLAVALELAAGILYFVYIVNNHVTPDLSLPINAYNIAFLLVAYFTILIGNINSNNSAYTGVLIYVFSCAFSAGLTVFETGFTSFASFFTGDPLTIGLTMVWFILAVLSLIPGVFTYVRLNQYLRSSFVSYEKVRNWALIFVILQTLTAGFSPVMLLVGGYAASNTTEFVLAILSPLSEVFICWAIYFTVLRLRSY